ncbi:hypothetical protein NG895_17620 [Aeoliella sp. ICT_H6.2]|uniref:Tetratricopeptide repeat protein n=1 Tax=Aeoliella straminimaris TaxID=2954799 RepID=A0A9X2FBA5_9BACT|nr:hypothetical protein [Aeoliella straminimaris]MCO6045720.1 hypothetical protein [Aeoliella straminimaris]
MKTPSAILLFTLALLCGGVARGDSTDQRYMGYLREQQMYRLAELYARQRLTSGDLDPRGEVELAIEHSLVELARAYDVPSIERQEHWQAAHQAIAPWIETKQPYSLLAELQDALNLLAETELTQLESLGRSDPAEIEQLQTRLRQAIALLKSAADDVEQRRREQALGQSRTTAEFSATELAGLERSIAIELARAYRLQGLTYPPASADRVNALQQAAESLTRLAAATPADDLVWRARLALARALAELNQTEQGLVQLASWRAEQVPAEYDDQLLAAEARLLQAAGRTDQALAKLAATPPGKSAAVDLMHLELLLSQNQRDSQAIEAQLAVVRGNHAPRYVRQAEAMVGEQFAASGDQTTAGGKVLAAEHFYRAGNYSAAVAAYDQAAELYRQQKDRPRAFAAERSAAAVMQRQRVYDQAATRFRRLALASIDRDDSAIDHREAILSLAEMARRSTGEAADQAMAEYLELCREHLRHWPMGQTAAEVRWWLASALAARGQWQATLAVLSEVDTTSPYYEEAIALLATTYRERIAELDDNSQRLQLVGEARTKLQPAIVGQGATARWPAKWSESQRTTALELARIMLDAGDASYAQNLLSKALNDPPPPPPEYVNRAAPVLAMALVAGGKTAEAMDQLRGTAQGGGSGASLEALADRLTTQLTEYARSPTPRRNERAALGQLLLEVVKSAGEGTSTWKLPADRYRAAALAAVANQAEARQLYESLTGQLPKNGDIQEEYAELLAASDTANDREAALARYALIESATRRGTDRWHRARQARIQLLTQLGRRAEAEKLEKLTRLLGGRK